MTNWNPHLIQNFSSFHASSFCSFICILFCFCFGDAMGLVTVSSILQLTRAQDSLVIASWKPQLQVLPSHQASKSFLFLNILLHIHQELFLVFSIWCKLVNSCYNLDFSNVKLCCISIHMLIPHHMSSFVRYLFVLFCSFFKTGLQVCFLEQL